MLQKLSIFHLNLNGHTLKARSKPNTKRSVILIVIAYGGVSFVRIGSLRRFISAAAEGETHFQRYIERVTRFYGGDRYNTCALRCTDSWLRPTFNSFSTCIQTQCSPQFPPVVAVLLSRDNKSPVLSHSSRSSFIDRERSFDSVIIATWWLFDYNSKPLYTRN